MSRHNVGPSADQQWQTDTPAARWYHRCSTGTHGQCVVFVLHALDKVSGKDQPSGDSCSDLFTTWLSSTHTHTHTPAVEHMCAIITVLPQGEWGRERRIDFFPYDFIHIDSAHPCSLAMRCSSLSSLPLKPFAKGLFSIFSWVIWRQSIKNIICTSIITERMHRCKHIHICFMDTEKYSLSFITASFRNWKSMVCY